MKKRKQTPKKVVHRDRHGQPLRSWRDVFQNRRRMICPKCVRVVSIAGSVLAVVKAENDSLKCHRCGTNLEKMESA